MSPARAGSVRTVSGDIAPAELGPTDYHEHMIQVSPLLVGDELDDEAASAAEARTLAAAGITAMVEATPIGLGRDPAAVARISAASGVRMVATTGAHRQAHYDGGDPLLEETVERLSDRFVSDLTRDARPGAPGGGGAVRAGLLKAGIGYWSISPFERRVVDAVAGAHRATGAPVMVHLEHGSASFEVLETLGQGGVPPDAVALAHMDRNADPGLHAELCAAGAFVGYDGMARHRERPDSDLLACLTAVVDRVGPGRILLGGDVARRSRYRAYGGMPGLDYLPRRFVPRLEAAAGRSAVAAMLVDNPAAWLGWRRT